MSFVYRCLAVTDERKPFKTRCKKTVAKNGIVCQDHYEECKYGPINVIMNSEVTSKFRIPFRNQVCVRIDLSKPVKKPVSNTENADRSRNARVRLNQAMRNYNLLKLKELHDGMELDLWDKDLLIANPMEFHKRIVVGIIEGFMTASAV